MSRDGWFKPRIRNYWSIGLSWCGSSQEARDARAELVFKTEKGESDKVKPKKFEQISFLGDGQFGVVKKYDNFDLSNNLPDYWQGK